MHHCGHSWNITWHNLDCEFEETGAAVHIEIMLYLTQAGRLYHIKIVLLTTIKQRRIPEVKANVHNHIAGYMV